MLNLRSALLAASLVAAGAAAAQMPAYDPQQLPAIQGRVLQYSLTPRGDVDGLILDDGTQVHLPPHLGAQLVYAVRPGDTVTVRGLKALAVPLVSAISVANARTGATVVDTGPPGGPPGPLVGAAYQVLTAQGRIRMQLFGRRGDLNGVLLDDGTQVHLPPPEAARLAGELAPGQALYASGYGLAGPLGRVLEASTIGPSAAQAVAITPPPPGGFAPPPPPPR